MIARSLFLLCLAFSAACGSDFDFNKMCFACGEGIPTKCLGQPCINGSCNDCAKRGAPPLPSDVPPDGCAAGNGIAAGAGVSACAGTFDPNKQAERLCAPGFALADGKRPIDASKLRGLGRFFVSAIAANMDKYKNQPANAECTPPSSGLRIRLLVGVGEGLGVAAMPAPCEGMPSYYDCRTAGGGFSCAWNTDPTQITNTNPSNGGLCAWKGWP